MPDTPIDISGSPARKPRRLRRAGVWSLILVMGLAVMMAGGVFWMLGRDVPAPDWLRTRIETRLAEVLPDTRIEFGDMLLVLDEGWKPRARVRNVRVARLDGTEIVAFSDVRASLALRPLIERRLVLKTLDVSGVFLTLRRNVDGRVSLSGGAGTAAPTRDAAGLAQLMGGVDDLLQRPGLSDVSRIGLRALTLRYEDNRAVRGWTVDGGRAQLVRDGDDITLAADLAVLGGGAEAATLSASYEGRIDSAASEFGLTIAGLDAGDIATQGPAFAWLAALKAPISGALRGGIDGSGTLAPLNATLQIGAGVIQPTPESQPIPIDSARSYFTYLPDRQVLRFDELSVRSKWVSGRLEGQAFLNATEATDRDEMVAQFQLSDLSFNPADLYDAPVGIDAAELDVRLRLSPFELRLGRMQISDQGRALTASGAFAAGNDGWSIALDARMDEIEPDRLMALWPQTATSKTRNWLRDNLLQGRLHDIDAAFRKAPGQVAQSYLSFYFDEATVRYLETMPPITSAKGRATLLEDRFVVAVDDGHVTAPQGGKVAVAGSSFIIPDVKVRGGAPAVVRLETSSTITAALALLDQPPIRAMDKADLPVTLADGRAKLSGTLSFPLIKGGGPSVVAFDAVGALTNVSSDILIEGRRLTASRLNVRASNDRLEFGGDGQLDNVPFNATWRQGIGQGAQAKSSVSGSIELSNRMLDAFGIALPPGSVSGQGTASVEIDLQKGRAPKLELTSDLRGLALSVVPVNWRKSPGTAGKLEISGTLSQPPQIDRIALSGPGLTANGSLALKEDGTLDRVSIDTLRVGDWLRAPVDLVGRGKNRPVAVNVRGGRLDLRYADFGGGGSPAGDPGVPMNVALDVVQITDTIALQGLTGKFSTGAGLDGTFGGQVNGGAPISGRIVPEAGRSAVRITANNAGQVFASAGVLKQARDGTLDLSLRPVGTGGAFDGTLKVSKTRVIDAPAMAALLNALSIVGLLDELGGTGIFFSQVDASFRLTPSRLTITQGSATGPSMGISMDGILATDTGQIQMQGVISPVYLLNGIGAILTRPGEGLIGFNYTLRGPTSEPRVTVNPLSALTPGMFRDLFRAPPPKAPAVAGETVRTPAPQPENNADNPPLVGADVGR